MNNERDIFEAGSELVNYAANTEDHGKYGTITDLFPYIHEASKKMGIRAISRWLKEERGVTISPATISRALRNAEPQWEGFSQEVLLPHALRIQEAYNANCMDFLFDQDDAILDAFTKTNPELTADDEMDAAHQIEEIDGSILFLRKNWYCLDKSTRLNCAKYFRD